LQDIFAVLFFIAVLAVDLLVITINLLLFRAIEWVFPQSRRFEL
jgi:hypothetical protein